MYTSPITKECIPFDRNSSHCVVAMVGLCFEDMVCLKGILSPIHLSLIHLLLSSLSSCLDDNVYTFVSIDLSQCCSLIILSTSHPPKVTQNVPLVIAAHEGHTDIVEQLIRAGAIIDHQNKVSIVT